MKSFKELRESSNPSMVQTTVDANIINNLVKFAQQLSGSFQPDMILIINKIENELNKFGLTLGDVDVDTPFEDSGTDDYVIQFYATKEPVKNMFLTLSWRKISGKQFEYTQEGAKLIHDVHLIVNITDPEDMDDILNSEDGDDEMTFVHLDEATIKTKEYSWGKIKTIHHGTDWSIPLHPEHQKAISSLEDEEETRFKDETGAKWRAIRFGDTIHFTGGDRGTYYGGTYKTSVLRKHLTEDMDSLDGDEQDCIKEALGRHEQGWDRSKSKIFSLTPEQESKKKEIVKVMKKKFGDFRSKYGEDAEYVMHATARKLAQKESMNEEAPYLYDVHLTAIHADTGEELQHQTEVKANGADDAFDKARSEMKIKYPKATYIANLRSPQGTKIDSSQLDEGIVCHGQYTIETMPKLKMEELGDIEHIHGSSIKTKKLGIPTDPNKTYHETKHVRVTDREGNYSTHSVYQSEGGEKPTISIRSLKSPRNHDYELHKKHARVLSSYLSGKKYKANLNESLDDIDYIKINIPAFIRCLEHAMEDVKEDAELHEFVENLLEISKTKDTITTDDYEKAVSDYDKGE